MSFSLAYLVMQMPVPGETFMSIEVRHLAKAGVNVQVFCLREPHPHHHKLLSQVHLSDIKIHYFPWFCVQDIVYWSKQHPLIFLYMLWQVTRSCWRRPFVWLKSIAIIPKSFSIVRAIQQENIQVVHAGWGHYPAVTACLITLLLPSVPVTLALTAYDRLEKHPVAERIAPRLAAIIAQSPGSADLLIHEWPAANTPVKVIHIGIELDVLEKYRSPEKSPGLIVSSARLVKEKGLHYLIEAFASIYPRFPYTRLVILGEGSYRATLEQQIARLGLMDCVELPGHLSQEIAFQHMACASIFVLPTVANYDTLPNAIKEATALEIPVITTPTLDIQMLIENGVSGIIVPKQDWYTLEKAIVYLLENPETGRQLAQNARPCVEALFDVEKTTQERLALYAQLLIDHA